MSIAPSFATLYRQSRYARTPEQAENSRQARRELFAVAGVAFLIKHDDAFRRTFLRQICGVAEADLNDRYDLEVQPAPHADLRLFCPVRRAVYVVEFKVDANLEAKQNPSQPEVFFSGPHRGYGWFLRTDRAYVDAAERTYVVLQNVADFDDGSIHGIKVLARTWKDLVDNPATESSLTRDLLDSLGAWIPALRFRYTTGMKKASRTTDAAEMFQIITVIAEELCIRPNKYHWDVQPNTGEGAHFGLDIPRGLPGFAKLEQRIGESAEALGWFGYFTGGPEGPILDIWFYCKPSKAADTPQTRTLRYLQERLGEKFGGVIEGQSDHARIRVGGDVVSDDKEWFAGVLGALRDR